MLLNWFANELLVDEAETDQQRLRTLGYVDQLVSKGMAMGFHARPLFPVLWEECMEQNLDELSQELGIVPVLEGSYSWTSNPAIMDPLT